MTRNFSSLGDCKQHAQRSFYISLENGDKKQDIKHNPDVYNAAVITTILYSFPMSETNNCSVLTNRRGGEVGGVGVKEGSAGSDNKKSNYKMCFVKPFFFFNLNKVY